MESHSGLVPAGDLTLSNVPASWLVLKSSQLCHIALCGVFLPEESGVACFQKYKSIILFSIHSVHSFLIH